MSFWCENPSILFRSIQLFSHPLMTLEEQLNAISRLLFIIAIILWLFDFKYALRFLIISLIFIIIIYYNQKNKMEEKKSPIENFVTYVPNTKPSPNVTYSRVKSNNVKSNNVKGNSVQGKSPQAQLSLSRGNIARGKDVVTINIDDEQFFCNDAYFMDNPNVISFNQKLSRQRALNMNDNVITLDALPATKIAPVIVPPAYDLESWRDNNLIVFSNINTPGVQQDVYLSGYAESECCDYLPSGTQLVPNCPDIYSKREPYGESYKEQRKLEMSRELPINLPYNIQYPTLIPTNVENYKPRNCGEIVSPYPAEDILRVPSIPVENNSVENYKPRNCGEIVSPYPAEDILRVPSIPVQNNSVENYLSDNRGRHAKFLPAPSGYINTACGYNPEQTKVNLPSNYPAGNCQQDPAMSRFNDNIFTQTVTPGVYMKNQVNEPIIGNMGISFTQQFEPVTYKRDDKGLMITLRDPNIIEPISDNIEEPIIEKANYDNVYDPRFYGYGTSYRSYLEPVTEQPRYMYDDINAIRMPNYIVRSKIDHLPYADQYGPVEEGSEFGNVHNPNIRALAQDSWFRDSISFRDDMTQRLMRKVNSEQWQKRMYPNSSRPVGSSCRIK
jgi:hypothetical protein